MAEDCGAALLEQVGKRAFRTPAGALLLEHAGRAFAKLEAAQEALRQLRGVVAGRLRLGTDSTASIHLLPPPLLGAALGLVRRRDKPEPVALRMFLAAVTALTSESRGKARSPGGDAAGRAARRAPR